MTEQQFLMELENALKRLPSDERNDILQDIREYFMDGREDGKTDAEIAASLGSPIGIAEELLAAYDFSEAEVNTPSANELMTIEKLYKNINIDVQHGALTIMPSLGDVTTIELVGRQDKMQLTADVIADTLHVNLHGSWLWSFMFGLRSVTVNVLMPKKLYETVTVKSDNGKIAAEKLLGQRINIRSKNGRISLTEMAASSLSAETNNGRIDIAKVQTDRLQAKTDNGRIELRAIEAEHIAVESDNGRIQMVQVSGDITGTTDNGRISLQTDHLDRNIDLQTDNGSIELQSDMKPTNVDIRAKTNHGRVDVFGGRNSRTVIGAGENVIRLKSANGRITVG
ncbi:DUF4097 family beta strand repeat-containing protein [Sporosarcina sp. HYO08]|uniref:DUF4097 family beta strand repeat-containing protein n=1 Tax=Sporosarcina sp. HYO08 TaxID=1759557 RepID=UPI00079862D0|nr:DUF4097 family beta strand repeat-containing protein [Sporosarcina sp. HYO08]KXH86883.1 hypothetical protein AU377_13695 [Sporosarcina sp. HYO08]